MTCLLTGNNIKKNGHLNALSNLWKQVKVVWKKLVKFENVLTLLHQMLSGGYSTIKLQLDLAVSLEICFCLACTNNLNAHICTFCKRWSFIWRCFFPMSVLNMLSYSVEYIQKINLLRLRHCCFAKKLVNIFKKPYRTQASSRFCIYSCIKLK